MQRRNNATLKNYCAENRCDAAAWRDNLFLGFEIAFIFSAA